MELEPVVVFFPLNLAISPALNRVSKTEAVIMSHDPAKNNSAALTWLPPCQAGQMPRLWGVRAWRPAGWPKPPKALPVGSLLSPTTQPEPSSLDSQSHSCLPCPEKSPDVASATPFLPSCSENPDLSRHRRLGAESTQAQRAPSCVPLSKWLYLSVPQFSL